MVESDYVLGEANDDHLDRGHDQSQSAKRQREEYEPTSEIIRNVRMIFPSGETRLDLQKIVSTKTLIMHLMIGVISVSATLIFHKGKPTCRVNGRRVVVTSVDARN